MSHPRKKRKKYTLLTRGRKTPLTSLLPGELYDRTRDIHIRFGEFETIYTKTRRSKTSYCVGLEDIYDIIDCTDPCNNVINTHAYMLKMELKADKTRRFKIFDAFSWTYIKDNRYEQQ